jgi:hypothetical protein
LRGRQRAFERDCVFARINSDNQTYCHAMRLL